MSRMNASVTVARTQPLTLVPQTSNVSTASTRAEPSDRLVGLADRRPQRGGRLRIAEIVLHIDDKDRGALAEANALPHALPSVEVSGCCFGVARHGLINRPE